MASSAKKMFRSLTPNLFLAALLAACSTTPQAPVDDDIRTLLDMQVDAWNNGDIDGYMTGYWHSDSTTFVSGGTRLVGYDSVLARYKRSYPGLDAMGHLTFSELEILRLSPGTVLARGMWHLQRKADEPWGRFTLIIEMKSEGWRIVYDHTSSAG